MSRLIGVVLVVFALMFGMTLAGCGEREPKEKKIKQVEKKAEGTVEEGEKKVEEVEKKVEETATEATEE